MTRRISRFGHLSDIGEKKHWERSGSGSWIFFFVEGWVLIYEVFSHPLLFFDGLYYHRIHHLKPPSKGEDVLMVHWFTKFPNRFESQIQADHFRTVMLGTRGLLT